MDIKEIVLSFWKDVIAQNPLGLDIFDDLVISVTRLWVVDNSMSFRTVSFIKFENDKIVTLDEYWGDDGIAPQWRQDKKIGKPIR